MIDGSDICVFSLTLTYSTHYFLPGVGSAGLWIFQTNGYNVTAIKSSTSLLPVAVNPKCFTGKKKFVFSWNISYKKGNYEAAKLISQKKQYCFVSRFKEYHSSGIGGT